MNKLFTIVLTHYNQMKYIYEAIDSILIQKYDNIELIITDDCSKEFNKKDITDYIKANDERKIIKKLNIIINDNNLGTVKTLNKALSKYTGDYIMFFAADDALYNENVILNLVKSFEKYNYGIITAQSFLYDEDLFENNGPYVNKKQAYKNNKKTPHELYVNMAKNCIYAAGSTAYKKEVFEKNGTFDEKYKLVEDWSYWLKLLRNNEIIFFVDVPVLKHRDGGVSHNNSNKIPPHVRQYYKDLINIHNNEIINNLPDFLTMREKYEILQSSFYHIYIMNDKIDFFSKKEFKLLKETAINQTFSKKDYKKIKIKQKIFNFVYWHIIDRIKNIYKYNKKGLITNIEWLLFIILYYGNNNINNMDFVNMGVCYLLLMIVNLILEKYDQILLFVIPLTFLFTYLIISFLTSINTISLIVLISLSYIIIYYICYIIYILIND